MQCIASQDIKENEKLSLVFLDTEFPVGGGVLGMENPGGGGQTRKDPPGVGGGEGIDISRTTQSQVCISCC